MPSLTTLFRLLLNCPFNYSWSLSLLLYQELLCDLHLRAQGLALLLFLAGLWGDDSECPFPWCGRKTVFQL